MHELVQVVSPALDLAHLKENGVDAVIDAAMLWIDTASREPQAGLTSQEFRCPASLRIGPTFWLLLLPMLVLPLSTWSLMVRLVFPCAVPACPASCGDLTLRFLCRPSEQLSEQ